MDAANAIPNRCLGPQEEKLSILLARPAGGTLQARLPQFARFALRLLDHKCTAAKILGGVQTFFTLLCHGSIVPKSMPCILLLVFLLSPRLAIMVIWLFSNYLDRAYHSILLILLGFLFLPLTTLVYAWEVNSGLPIAGLNLVWLGLAALIDAGAIGGGRYHQKRR